MSCATDGCVLAPDLCEVCRWLAFRIVGCDLALETGRCRLVIGHPPPCQPTHKTKAERAS